MLSTPATENPLPFLLTGALVLLALWLLVKWMRSDEFRRRSDIRARVRRERATFRKLHGRNPSRRRDGYLESIDWANPNQPQPGDSPEEIAAKLDDEPVDARVIRARREGK